MELNYLLTWLVVASCIITAVQAYLNPDSNSRGWIPMSLLVLAATALLYLLIPSIAGFLALGLMITFLVVPSRLFLRMDRLRANDEYEKVLSIGKIMRWLHPFYHWQQWADNQNAYKYEHLGEFDKARELLEKHRSSTNYVGQYSAMQIELNKAEGDWQSIKEWFDQEMTLDQISANSSHSFHYVRALGETGMLNEMVQFFGQHLTQLAKNANSFWDAHIIVLAFCGKYEAVTVLINTPNCLWDERTKKAWLGTAYSASGDIETGQQIFESLLQVSNAQLKRTIMRRLSNGVNIANEVLTNESKTILKQTEENLQQWKTEQANISKFSLPIVTYSLLAINTFVFFIEMRRGATSDFQLLIDMGALWPVMIINGVGNSWSILAANFLHAGWLHLLLNMLALFLIGPPLEFMLGRFRFLLIYLVSGIAASLIIIMLTQTGVLPEHNIYLGASACILGLFGAELVVALRAWRLQKFAKDRIVILLVYLGIQISFDLSTPGISLASHLVGFITGFILTIIIYRPHQHLTSKSDSSLKSG